MRIVVVYASRRNLFMGTRRRRKYSPQSFANTQAQSLLSGLVVRHSAKQVLSPSPHASTASHSWGLNEASANDHHGKGGLPATKISESWQEGSAGARSKVMSKRAPALRICNKLRTVPERLFQKDRIRRRLAKLKEPPTSQHPMAPCQHRHEGGEAATGSRRATPG